MIWFLSIKHTGTHFLFEHLRNLGLAQGRVDIKTRSAVSVADSSYFHFHIEDHPDCWDMADGKIITTMRNPVDVFKSHDKRSPQALIDELEKKVLSAFNMFESFILEYGPYILKVDDGDKQSEIFKLANFLNVDPVYEEVDVLTAKATTINRNNAETRFIVPESIRALSVSYGYKSY